MPGVSKGSRIFPEMSKRSTPPNSIPEAPSLKQKRSFSSPAAVQTIRVSESLVKNLPTNYPSRTRNGGGKLPQSGHSRNRNRLAKKSSPNGRGKHVGSAEVQHSSRNEKRKNGSFVVHGRSSTEVFCDATDVHYAASFSSTFIPQSVEPLLPELLSEDTEDQEPVILPELMDDIIGRLPMVQVMKLRAELGKEFRNAIHRPAFCQSRPEWEGEFGPSFFTTDGEGDLHWHGFDTKLRKWTRLPSLNFAKKILPSPDSDLFKDYLVAGGYLVAGDGGLLCFNAGKASGREKLVMCNPLTQQAKVLPPLNYARHPVLMHLKVDHDTGHYKVIVAGSAAIGTEKLSLKTEIYDSRKGVWRCPDGSDLPCKPFGLNEYQNGVYYTDFERELLFCIAFVDERGRGVLMYDVKKMQWAQGPTKLHIPLMRGELNDVSHLITTQIVECGGSVFLFSEQECGWDTYFMIHKLVPDVSGDFTWDEVMRQKRTIGKRGLLVYPEFILVPVSEHLLCIFDAVEHTIETIDLNKPTEVTPLGAAPITSKGNRFHSLNPIGFVYKPSFRSVVCPRGRNFEFRCDLEVREYCSECESKDPDSLVTSTCSPPINVCPKVINRPAFVEEAGLKVASTAPEETHATRILIEPGESEEALIEKAGKVCEDIHKFLDQFSPKLI